MYGGEGDDYMIGAAGNATDGDDATLDGDFMRGGPGDDIISDGLPESSIGTPTN